MTKLPLTRILMFCLIFDTFLWPSAVDAMPKIPVQVRTMTKRQSLTLAGKIRPARSEELHSKWGCQISKFHVLPGAAVRKGELIAEVDSSYKKSLFEYAMFNMNFYRELERLIKLEIDSGNRRIANIEPLVKTGVMPSDELERARVVANQNMDNQKSLVEATIRFQEEAKQRQEEIREGNFYSTIDGIVTELATDPRQLVGGFQVPFGGLVARVDQPQEYEVVLATIDTQVVTLKLGQVCRVKIEGLPPLKCSVTGIPQSATETKDGSRKYNATVGFIRAGTILPRDILAIVEVSVGPEKMVKLVPKSAIFTKNGKAVVRGYRDSGGWSDVPVTLGMTEGDMIEIANPEPRMKGSKREITIPELVEAELYN